MEKLTIRTHPPYDVLLGRGLLAQSGALAAQAVPGRRAMIVFDDRVTANCLQAVQASFAAAGFAVSHFSVAHGEDSKSLSTLADLLNAAVDAGLTREDLFAALGGGVVGDLAGFAAAVYLRGVDFVQLPTTLLAMVDACVGGKTAVNLPGGKNLCGAFHQPRLVICDPDTLSTLPPAVYAEGMAEIIKHGAICDEGLLDQVREGAPIEHLISASLRIKGELVCRDERDLGPRQLLNFGHTFGHALEKLNDYRIYHGEGVAVGMVIAAFAAEHHGLCAPGVCRELRALLTENRLPVTTPFNAAQIARCTREDKKRRGDSLTLVLPVSRGRCLLHPLPAEDLAAFTACCDGKVTGL